MRKLIESTPVSLDGVIEAPERWSPFDEEATQLTEDLCTYDAFVMGRVTYERFRANWAPVSGNPYIDLINATAQARRLPHARRADMERDRARSRHRRRHRAAQGRARERPHQAKARSRRALPARDVPHAAWTSLA
jgi:hypothetical protein